MLFPCRLAGGLVVSRFRQALPFLFSELPGSPERRAAFAPRAGCRVGVVAAGQLVADLAPVQEGPLEVALGALCCLVLSLPWGLALVRLEFTKPLSAETD